MKSVSIINKLVNPFIGLFRWQIYKRPIVFWLSKRLLTLSEIVDLSYLTFTNCLPSVLIVKNSQITTLLKRLAYLQDTTVNSYLFERFISNFFSNANHFESQFSIEHNHEFEKLDQIRKILFSYDYFEIGFGVFAEDVFFVKKNLIN